MPRTKRNGIEEYEKKHIPNSIFFDLDKNSKKNTKLPHMLVEAFEWEKIFHGNIKYFMENHCSRELMFRAQPPPLERHGCAPAELAAGMRADLCVWDVDAPAELAYYLGLNKLAACFRNGAERAL